MATVSILSLATMSVADEVRSPAAAKPAAAPAAPAAAPAAPAAAPARANYVMQPVATADPYGFTQWLNATRASYGLPAVGYDPNLTNWAAVNNAQQNARGIGHYVMGPARRQNSAMGAFSSIGQMWMNSPAHRAALLDPTIRWIGIAGSGAYWTFNAF
jgi:uncharacterized protein YkwD